MSTTRDTLVIAKISDDPAARLKLFPDGDAYNYTERGGAVVLYVNRKIGGMVELLQAGRNHRKPTRGIQGLGSIPPYRAHVLATAPADAPIVFFLHEADSDQAAAWGLTTSAIVDNSYLTIDDNTRPLFEGRTVAIVIRDQETFETERAPKLARLLDDAPAEIKIIPLPGWRRGDRIDDWRAKDSDPAVYADMILALILASPAWIDEPDEDEPEADEAERPIIIISTEERRVNDEAVVALARDPNLYQFGQVLATVIHDQPGKPPRNVDQPDGPPPQISAVELATLRERMAEAAEWKALCKGKDEREIPRPAHPPTWSVQAVHARRHWPDIRPIKGVVEAPTIRPDGTILCDPGYDPVTALYFHPNDAFPAVPDRPTLDQARKASNSLLDLVTDFPFADGHRVAWLAALLTVIGRAAIDGPTPLFAIDGNCPGAGKSMLADLIAVVATRRRMARTIWPTGRDADEEIRKRITALLMTGEPMMLLDNIALGHPLGGASLDSALTSTTWKDRILGKSQATPELPMRMVTFATGNNITFRSDILRRVIPCRLVTMEEKPEEREGFRYPDLLGHVKANRGQYLAAALTILRGYYIAGMPGKIKPLGSYESWTKLIAGSVLWATGLDPMASRNLIAAEDVDTQRRRALFEGLGELPRMRSGMTASEIRNAVIAGDAPTLREALLEFSRDNDIPTPRTIGTQLRSLKDRVITIGDTSQRLTSHEDSHAKIAKWVLARVDVIAGSAGSSGVNCQPYAKTSSEHRISDHPANSVETTPHDPAHPADRERGSL